MRLPLLFTLPDAARRALPAAIDALAPPTCPATAARLSGRDGLSASAWAGLTFIDDPCCAACAAPFAHDEGEGAVCGACAADPPDFDAARAALVYDRASHPLIVAFKHGDRTDLAPMFSRMMARAAAPLLAEGVIIAPTPLHPRRLFARRYNQSALLARLIAKTLGARFEPQLLLRTRATPPQAMLSADARRRNVAGAFSVAPERCAQIDGAAIILVDDVMTTGATLSACARALKKAGARSVAALTLARALKTADALG
jgi:ComF family protein